MELILPTTKYEFVLPSAKYEIYCPLQYMRYTALCKIWDILPSAKYEFVLSIVLWHTCIHDALTLIKSANHFWVTLHCKWCTCWTRSANWTRLFTQWSDSELYAFLIWKSSATDPAYNTGSHVSMSLPVKWYKCDVAWIQLLFVILLNRNTNIMFPWCNTPKVKCM